MSLTLILGGAFTLVLITIIILQWIGRNKRPQGFPPGPRPLPILGNLHQVGLEAHISFIKLGKKYGGIFGIDYGSYRSVVINDVKLIKQCFNNPAFSGRPKFQIFLDKVGPGSKCTRGIASTELRPWTEQRRFALKSLRNFGFGKNMMETIIQEEIQEFVDSLRPHVGRPIKTSGLLNAAIVNSLWRICTGDRTAQNDPELQKLLGVLLDGVSAVTPLVVFFPIVGKIFPNLSGYNDTMAALKAVSAFIKSAYNAKKVTLISGEPRGLMDLMIEEVANTTDPTSSFYRDEGESHVLNSLGDLFLAGAETTSTTLTWLLLFMALFPEIQEQMSVEIQKVVGPSRQTKLTDRLKLPFTECVIMEVMRYAPVLIPLGIMHKTVEEISIGGYIIPKNTVVTSNLYAVFHDEEIWGDPEIFRPQRFLLPDGVPNKTHEAFIPFSVGKRICLGEKLAEDEIFLFTASIFQQFRVSTNPNGPKPTLTAKAKIVMAPIPHELILHDRHF